MLNVNVHPLLLTLHLQLQFLQFLISAFGVCVNFIFNFNFIFVRCCYYYLIVSNCGRQSLFNFALPSCRSFVDYCAYWPSSLIGNPPITILPNKLLQPLQSKIVEQQTNTSLQIKLFCCCKQIWRLGANNPHHVLRYTQVHVLSGSNDRSPIWCGVMAAF